MSAITASEARKNLFRLIEQVNNDHAPVEIISKAGSAMLVSKENWDSMEETAHLLRSPANAEWLSASMDEFRRGEAAERGLDR